MKFLFQELASQGYQTEESITALVMAPLLVKITFLFVSITSLPLPHNFWHQCLANPFKEVWSAQSDNVEGVV